MSDNANRATGFNEAAFWGSLEVAKLRADYANQMKMLSLCGLVFWVFTWAWATSRLEGDVEAEVQGVCLLLAGAFALFWWTALRHHRERKDALSALAQLGRQSGLAV